MVAARPGISPMAVRGVLLFFGISAIIAGILIMIHGVCTIGSIASPTHYFQTDGYIIEFNADWASSLRTINVVVPIGLILLAVGLLCLAYVYSLNLGYLASALLIVLGVIVWVFHFAAPDSPLGLRASSIVLGGIFLVSMIVTCLALREISFKLRGAILMMISYILILLFGILGGVGNLVSASLSTGVVRAGGGLAGVGGILGGIAGILLFIAFLSAFMGPRAPAAPAPRIKEKGVFCAECGAPISPGARFCPKCGTKVR